jgi:hypothetical protein
VDQWLGFVGITDWISSESAQVVLVLTTEGEPAMVVRPMQA